MSIQQLKEAYIASKNYTKTIPNVVRRSALLELVKALKPNTQHTAANFIYIGYMAEHLKEFEECETFWLSPRKIMDLEEFGECSSRNRDVLEVWLFMYDWNTEFQVSFNKQTGWCSLI